MNGISPNLAFLNDSFQQGFRLIDPQQLNLVFQYLMPTLTFWTKSGDYDVIDTDHTIIINKTVGQITSVWLEPIPVINTRLQIKDGRGDATTNPITIQGNGNTIDGSSTSVINTNYGSIALVFNGTQWNVFSTVSSGGGGGGNEITSEQDVTSGSTATAVLSQIVVFKSASGTPKTVTAPTSTGSLSVIEVADAQGDAFTSPITFAPLTGSVVGGQNQVYTNYGSARFRDTAQGWMNV